MQLADEAGVGFVCVQSLKVHLAREADDYTRDKTDHKDAVLIGNVLIGTLISRLDCYPPRARRGGLGPAAASGAAPVPPGRRGGRVPQSDQRPALVLLAGSAGVRDQAAGVHDLAGMSGGHGGSLQRQPCQAARAGA
jgi:hypothetical protein